MIGRKLSSDNTDYIIKDLNQWGIIADDFRMC